MNQSNPKADFYFRKNERWQPEITLLRSLVLDCGLQEELKWGCPCYTYDQKNVVLIHVFKSYCALLFFKGALLEDTADLLVQQTPKVQGPRQLRFTNREEIEQNEQCIKGYIFQAVEVEKAGLKVPARKDREPIPEEFKEKLQEDPALKEAFQGLTPGRQRAYILYFSDAKQAKTRYARIEKHSSRILSGKGLND